MEAEKPPIIDGKGLKNRLSRQSRRNRRYLLPICYQKHNQVGVGLIVGDQPFFGPTPEVDFVASKGARYDSIAPPLAAALRRLAPIELTEFMARVLITSAFIRKILKMPADFFTTEKRTLGVVLSNTTPPLRVAEYQRDFSWEQRQISDFWNDLEHFDQLYPGTNINGKEYFLGAAVFVNNETTDKA
jgi:hypothetical protein